MTKRLLVLGMFAVLVSVPDSAVPATSAPTAKVTAAGSEPRQIADDAMKFVAAEDMKGFFEFIGGHIPMERAELIKVRDNIVGQRTKTGAAHGKLIGATFISECRRSDFLVRILYAEKREKDALRWEFIFYKARNVWKLASFNWDSNLHGLFVTCN